MEVEILFDVAGLAQPGRWQPHRHLCFPLSAKLADGAVVCIYRQGATKHSHDGVLLMQRSADGGRHWSAPQTVANVLNVSPTQTVITGGLCQTPELALGFLWQCRGAAA